MNKCLKDDVNNHIESCRNEIIDFVNNNKEAVTPTKQKIQKGISMTKVNGQECCSVHIQSSFFIAMPLTCQSEVGAFTSLSANMRKIESNGLSQKNDKNETLVDAMQHTDHASFNESAFESTHHILFNPTTGANNENTRQAESCHHVTSDKFTNEALIEKDTDFRNINESNMPFLSCLFNCPFDLVTCKRNKKTL